MKLLFAGKYCKNLDPRKFQDHICSYIEEFEDYEKYLDDTDIIISYGYGKIFKDNALKKKIFNIHPSVLPYGRGIYSIVWSIYFNHPIGYTIYQINSDRIDEGFVYSSKKIEYNSLNTFRELFHNIAKSAEEDFEINFNKYLKNQSFVEIKDEEDIFYKSKKDSKVIDKYLKNGWDTKVEDFLFYTKNINL